MGFLLGVSAAWADDDVRPHITSADTEGSRVFIRGSGFRASAAPVVLLAGTALTVESYSPSAIVASIPGTMPVPGTYVLAVRSNARGERGERLERGDRPGRWPHFKLSNGSQTTFCFDLKTNRKC